MTRTVDTGTDQLLCTVEDHVATVTFNRPEKRNALGDIVSPALRDVLLALDSDADVRIVVITGAGKAFCSGGDVSGMGSGLGPKAPPEDRVRDLQRKQEALTLRLHELSKPTIASLPGAAAGAGMSIALACDIRIAAKSAFLVTGFGRVGLSGDYGGSWFLTQLVGPAKAKELYLTGGRILAEEALLLGLVNKIVPDADLAAATMDLAKLIANGPPLAQRFMKENINRATTADLRTCLGWEAERTVTSAGTADHKEAVAAFLEKRAPVFRGE